MEDTQQQQPGQEHAQHEHAQHGQKAGTTLTLNKKTLRISAAVALLLLLSPLVLTAVDVYAKDLNNATLTKIAHTLPFPALRVDGSVYTVAELDVELANLERVLNESGAAKTRAEMIEMLRSRLVRAAAVERLAAKQPVDMEVAMKLARSVTFGESMTDEQIAEAVKTQFNWSTDYFYAHVLTPYAREMAFAFAVLKPQADALAAEVRAPGADFAAVAKLKGEDASKESGGDLGWFKKGAMVPEFESQIWNAKKGDVVGPFASRFGWHMVKVVDIRGEGEAKEVKASHIIIALKNHESDIEPKITEASKDVKVSVYAK